MKYESEDKIVLRKDLKIGEIYGGIMWTKDKDYLKNKEFLIIDYVDFKNSSYSADDWTITDEMIESNI